MDALTLPDGKRTDASGVPRVLRIYRRFLERAPTGHPVAAAIRALIARSEGQGGVSPAGR